MHGPDRSLCWTVYLRISLPLWPWLKHFSWETVSYIAGELHLKVVQMCSLENSQKMAVSWTFKHSLIGWRGVRSIYSTEKQGGIWYKTFPEKFKKKSLNAKKILFFVTFFKILNNILLKTFIITHFCCSSGLVYTVGQIWPRNRSSGLLKATDPTDINIGKRLLLH